MEYIIKKPFKFAHGGVRVEEFEPGKEPRELTEECAEVAVAEGWAKPVRAGKAAQAASGAADAQGNEGAGTAEAGAGGDAADAEAVTAVEGAGEAVSDGADGQLELGDQPAAE